VCRHQRHYPHRHHHRHHHNQQLGWTFGGMGTMGSTSKYIVINIIIIIIIICSLVAGGNVYCGNSLSATCRVATPASAAPPVQVPIPFPFPFPFPAPVSAHTPSIQPTCHPIRATTLAQKLNL